jgi:hypothetical protein
MNWSLIPTSVSTPPSAPAAAPQCSTHEGHQEQDPDQRTPERTANRSGCCRVEQLIELNMPVWLLHRDYGVAQLDQIFLLYVEELLADFFGLRFGGERNSDQIGHHNLYLLSGFPDDI